MDANDRFPPLVTGLGLVAKSEHYAPISMAPPGTSDHARHLRPGYWHLERS